MNFAPSDTSRFSPRLPVLLFFILLAVVGRVAGPLLPHFPNFAPLDAMALFGGAYFARKRWAVLVPLLAVWGSDLILNYQYTGYLQLLYPGWYWQYGCYALMALLAHAGLRQVTPLRVALGATTAAVIFFIVSNFGVWVGSAMYPHTGGGLLACYVAALPFFSHSLLSNLVYCSVLFGGFELAQWRFPVLGRVAGV